METYIKLVKKDADSGKIVSLNSATFQIKHKKWVVQFIIHLLLIQKI